MPVNSLLDESFSLSSPIKIIFICISLLFFLSISPNAMADDLPETNLHTFSMYLENDYFAGKDGEYSSGLQLTWSSGIRDQYP